MNTMEKARILIADDSVALRQRIVQFMKLEGFTTIEAGTGEEALSLALEHRPDLILLDVIMPGGNGIEVCRELRSKKEFDKTPIVMLTVKSSAYDVSEAFKAGASDYIRKPFGAEELLLRIRVHLKNHYLLQELEKINQIKNEFIGMAAHDIRSPLTNILGLTRYLKKIVPEPNEEINFALTNLEEEGDRILNLVNTMLDLSVIQSGKFSLIKVQCSLFNFVEDVQRRITSMIREKNIVFVLEKPQEDLILLIDPYRIHQVLDNLFSNSIRYAPEKSRIRLQILKQNRFLIFEVCDEGPGISKENVDKIFTPFFRDKTTVKKESFSQGVGLGLAIAKKIIDEHSGQIGIRQDGATGALFWFSLPLT